MNKDYQIITAESYLEFKHDVNEFFPSLSDFILWHFWKEIEKSANEEECLFDRHHRNADDTIKTSLADTYFISDYCYISFLYSEDYYDSALAHNMKQMIYSVLPIKEAFIIIYMPKDDKFSEREYEYIESCLYKLCEGMRLLCIVKETPGSMRVEIHVSQSH